MSGHNTTASAPSTAKSISNKKTSGGGNKKGTSAERRATHNAVERARRESLNVRFLELAANLPATCTVRRPSKSLIVNKSLEFVDQALNAESILRLKVEELLHENQTIMEELNLLRQDRGLSPRASSIEASLPLPLAESDFKKHSTRANLALSRGSFSLGGDYDDDYSGQASNSSLSSTGSPPDALRGNSALPVGFQSSPKLSDSGAQFFVDPTQSFHTTQQQQNGGFSLPTSYYAHGPTQQHHHHHNQQQQNSSDFPPITPTTAAMFTHMMGAYSSSSEGTHDSLSNVGQNPLGLDDQNQSAFAIMASNSFFDQRYSNTASVSTPTSGSYTTTA